MNKADQERLLELKIHVWAKVARSLLEGDEEEKDPYFLYGSQIESHGGRVGRAIRLLTDAGIIAPVKLKDRDGYKVLRLEEAKALATKPVFNKRWDGQILADVKALATKPVFNKRWDGQILADVNDDIDKYPKLNTVGYKIIEKFSYTEILYIYFYKDEFDIPRDYSSGYSDKEHSWNVYYLKELTVFRNKMVLKALIEIELQDNFPQYVQHYVGYSSNLIYPSVKEEFVFKKYAISSVFLSGSLDAIFESYQNNTNKANAMNDAFNRTKAWVESVGGYPAAIKIIRNRIMNDFADRTKRFLRLLDAEREAYMNDERKDYDARFRFVRDHMDLFNYQTLYIDPELQGEAVLPLSLVSNGWSRNDTLKPVDFKEEFDEPENEGDALKKQAA